MTECNVETQSWHIACDILFDGTPLPPDDRWLELPDGAEPEHCSRGYHASDDLLTCLRLADGTIICRVELRGEIKPLDGKRCARARRIVWRVEGREIIMHFARWCAWQVREMWEMPDVVRQWLLTGDESLLTAAAYTADRAAAASSAASSAAYTAAAYTAASAYTAAAYAACAASSASSAASSAAYTAACAADRAAAAAAAYAAYTASAASSARAAAYAVHQAALTRAIRAAHDGRDWRAEIPIEEEDQ